MKVFFCDVSEFVSEVTKDVTLVERQLVRATIITTIGSLFTVYYLCCAAIIAGRVVEARERIGECITHDSKTRQEMFLKTDNALTYAEQQLSPLGLEIRRGLFVEHGKEPA